MCVCQEDSSPSDQQGIPPSSPSLWLPQCSQPQRTQLLPDGTPAPWFFQPLVQGEDWGRGWGAKVKQTEMHLLSLVVSQGLPPSQSIRSGIHPHRPRSRSQPDLQPGVREEGCAPAGLVPEATPCTTPSRVLLPAGTKRSTRKDSELREQTLGALWLQSLQRDSAGSGHPGPITASLGPQIPQVPLSSLHGALHTCFLRTLSSSPLSAPPPPEMIPTPSGMLPGSQQMQSTFP